MGKDSIDKQIVHKSRAPSDEERETQKKQRTKKERL